MRQSLLESVVLNPQEVDQFAHDWDSHVNFPLGREWMYKRIRQFVLNNEHILTPVAEHDIPPNAPPYVIAAVERGETVFQFSPDWVQWQNGGGTPGQMELMHQADIIADFLSGTYTTATQNVNAANQVAREDKTLAEKTIAKLSKMSWLQAFQAANQWAERGTKRASKLSKEGGDVVMQWPDGYYAIKFTSAETMRRDGAQLQNCLGQGNYWAQVKNGSQMVIAIRRPNDEAVVGLRFNASGTEIMECKGKNNKTINAAYVPYVVDLLTAFQTSNRNHDLEQAGIKFNTQTKMYGTLKDIAQVVSDKNGIKVYETPTQGVVETKGRDIMFYTINGDHLASVDFAEQLDFHRKIALLNAVGRNGDRAVVSTLGQEGIYSRHGKWGDISMVGQHIGSFTVKSMVFEAYQLGSHEVGNIILQAFNQSPAILSIQHGQIVSADNRVLSLGAAVIAKIANTAFLRCAPLFEDHSLHPKGYAYVRGKEGSEEYVYIPDINKPVQSFALPSSKYADDQDGPKLPLYRAKQGLWLLQSDDSDETFALIEVNTQGQLHYSVTEVRGAIPINPAIRWMFKNGHAKKIAEPEIFGIAVIPSFLTDNKKERYTTDPEEYFAALQNWRDAAYYPFGVFGENECGSYLGALSRLQRSGEPLSVKAQRAMVKALSPVGKTYRITKEKDESFANLEYKHYSIQVADALMQVLAPGDLLTDPACEKAAVKIRQKIEAEVSELFQKTAGKAIYDLEGYWPWGDLAAAVRNENEAMILKIKNRKAEIMGDRTVPLADKFKALNTADKLKRR